MYVAFAWRQSQIQKLAIIIYSFVEKLDKVANFDNSYYVLIQHMKEGSNNR
jgi:hypothetical protein